MQIIAIIQVISGIWDILHFCHTVALAIPLGEGISHVSKRSENKEPSQHHFFIFQTTSNRHKAAPRQRKRENTNSRCLIRLEHRCAK